MNKLICLRGCPASGKTSWAFIKQMEGNGNSVRANRDDIRRSYFPSSNWPGYNYSKANEQEVTRLQEEFIRIDLKNGYDVVCDDTNLDDKTFKRLKSLAQSCKVEFEVKEFFDVPLHKLIDRNLKREWSVPEDVIHRMFKKQLEIQGRIITPTEGLPDCIICDVDGTIADMQKGKPEGRGPFEWDKVGNDLPKQNVIEAIENLSNKYKIIFLTGRDGVAYNDTNVWITNNLSIWGNRPLLFSREAGDERADCVIKEEILRREVLPTYNVKLVWDDRQCMVDHWRALGLECWQVDAGRF